MVKRNTRDRTLLYLASVLIVFFSSTAQAHEVGITDTGIEVSRDSLQVTYTVPDDLVETLEYSASSNPSETVSSRILAGFTVRNANNLCESQLTGQRTLDAIGSTQFDIRYSCCGPVTDLHLQYELFFEQDSSHVNVVRISLLGRSQDVTLTSENREHNVDVEALVRALAAATESASSSPQSRLAGDSDTFGQEIFGTEFSLIGIKHRLLGFDQVLFLICLTMLPMRLLTILALVTPFTIAHSITLSLSTLNWVTLPPGPVEAIIAASIVYVSFRNVWILSVKHSPIISESDSEFASSAVAKIHTCHAQKRERLLSSFMFGLVHGFGFSYVLKEVGLGEHAFASLLFFNLGVEFGQLIIITILLPVLWRLSKRYSSLYWVRGASTVTGLIVWFWLIERLVVL